MVDEQKDINLPLEDQDKKLEDPKAKKKNSFVKYILNIIFVLAVTAITVGITFAQESQNIFNALQDIKWNWIFAAIGLVFLAFVFRSIIYLCFARLYTRKYHLYHAAALDQIGVFYSGVTPGASGGQFMQAYTYKKQGLPISAGASIMVMSSIIYQIMLIIYGLLSLAIRSDILAEVKPFQIGIGGNTFDISIIPLIIIGFLINILIIGVLLLMSYWKGFHHFMCGPMISFLATIHLVKDKDHASESLRIQVENFKIELRRLLSNIPFTLLISFLYFCVLTCIFGVPCFVGKALGADYELSWSTFWESVFMSNFHQMVTGLIPIPGSAGVSELFFFQLFDPYFKGDSSIQITAAAQLIWRTITFTLPVFVGGLVAAFYHASPKEEVQNRDLNLHTFVALQHETYVEREASMERKTQTSLLTKSAIISSLKQRDKKEREEKKRLKELEKLQKLQEENWKEFNIGDDEEEE